jgi:CoA:oxalate CoA-transferase
MAQALDSGQARARDLIVPLGDGQQALRAVGSPVKFDGYTPTYGMPPLLDEHHEQVLGRANA